MSVKSLFIFDWDDTLYPTKHRSVLNGSNIDVLDQLIYNLLNECLKYAQVGIVSLGTHSWIDGCMSNLHKTRSLKTKIMFSTARKYLKGKETVFLENAKMEAQEVIWKYYSCPNIVISIGDSLVEKKSIRNLAETEKLIYKTVLLNYDATLTNMQHFLPLLSRKIKFLATIPKITNIDCFLLQTYGDKLDQEQVKKPFGIAVFNK